MIKNNCLDRIKKLEEELARLKATSCVNIKKNLVIGDTFDMAGITWKILDIDERGYVCLADDKLDETKKFEEAKMQLKMTFYKRNGGSIMENKGYTVTFIPWEDMEGKERVAGRFKTEKEKDDFLKEIHKSDSSWMMEELATVCVINDYNYVLQK